MKENAKKERTEEKREIRRTGGGAAQHSMTQEAQIVCGMLPPEQLDAQLEAMDSDYRVQPPSFHTPSPNSPIASSSYIFPLSQHETVAIPSPPEGGILASTTVSPPDRSQVVNQTADVDVAPLTPRIATTGIATNGRHRRRPRTMSAFHQALLDIAQTEHEAKMRNLELKRQILQRKLDEQE